MHVSPDPSPNRRLLLRQAPIIFALVALFAGWTGARLTVCRTSSMSLDQAILALRQEEQMGPRLAAAVAAKDQIVQAIRALRVVGGDHADHLMAEIAREAR